MRAIDRVLNKLNAKPIVLRWRTSKTTPATTYSTIVSRDAQTRGDFRLVSFLASFRMKHDVRNMTLKAERHKR